MVEGGILVQVHVSLAVAYGDAIVRLRTEFHGDQGTLEAQHDFLGRAAGVRIRGCRRGEKFQDLATPPDLLTGTDPADIFSPYRLHSAGPRHFVDSIIAGKSAVAEFPRRGEGTGGDRSGGALQRGEPVGRSDLMHQSVRRCVHGSAPRSSTSIKITF